MSDEAVEVLKSFRAFLQEVEQGAVIPEVDEHDLKCLHQLCVERAKRYCGKDGVISLESTSRACSQGANVPAVWLRHTQLRTLYRQGLLSEWQRGTTLDDMVFKVAAKIPMRGADLDQDSFLRQLRDQGVAPHR